MVNKLSLLEGFPKERLSEGDIVEFGEAARLARQWVLTMTTAANSGHPAGSLSSMEMYLVTYAVSSLRPYNADSLDRDFVVISHGHTSPGAYAALAYYGFFSPEELLGNFRRAGSPFEGHVERGCPGIDWGTGNLGQGLAAGVGFALAMRARGAKNHVYVLMGDGEQVKGQVAEARRIANKEKLSSITAIIDYNHIQISGRVEEIMPADVAALWKADGWLVYECDGHDVDAIYRVLRGAVFDGRPSVILCHTLMGKGVSFMEGTPEFHGKAATKDLYIKAMEELGGSPELLERALAACRGPLPKKRRIPSPVAAIDTGEPRTYAAGEKLDNRSAFGNALVDVGSLNYGKEGHAPVLVFDCDLAGSVKTEEFAKRYPDWFIEAGIQEHATATASGAASCAGVVSCFADFGVFGVGEAYNQQRLNDINGANLKLFLTHVGLDVGEDGATHQCIDYVGLLRNTFGWRLVVPADPNQTDRAVRWALSTGGNVCVAMGRSKVPVVVREDGSPFFAGDYAFRYGAMELLRDGSDGAILAMGAMVYRAVEVWEKLRASGYNVKVYSVSCPLELDDSALADAAKTGLVVTYEDHHVRSGMGSLVALRLTERGITPPLFKTLGVHRYGDSGAAPEVLSAMGLSVEHLVEAVVELITQKQRLSR